MAPAKPSKKGIKGQVYNLKGEVSAEVVLPEALFGQKVNQALLTQALRVYQTNQSGIHGHTKTRGEVAISTRKIYKQKGTGGARHGAKSAPIFVGGGVAMGPRRRQVVLELPKKMARAALISALSKKAKDQQVVVVEGLEKASGKTKEMAGLAAKIGGKKLAVVAETNKESMQKAYRASANLATVDFELADQLNAWRVLTSEKLVLTPAAIDKLAARVGKEQG